MTLNQSERPKKCFVAPSASNPIVGILPLGFYVSEFTPKVLSCGQWEIRHRDSSERAYVTAGHWDTQSSDIVWQVATTMCGGTAEFSNYRTAERYIAIMFRGNAGRRHYEGEPRSCFRPYELWWAFKSELFRRHSCD